MLSKKEETELRKMTREILHEELRKMIDELHEMAKLDEETTEEDLRKVEA